MRKLFILLLLTTSATVAGCASTLPTCDGKNRRSINTPDRAELIYPSCGNIA